MHNIAYIPSVLIKRVPSGASHLSQLGPADNSSLRGGGESEQWEGAMPPLNAATEGGVLLLTTQGNIKALIC